MPHGTFDIRTMLSLPFVYDLFQDMVGAGRWRRDFSNNFIRPKAADKILDIGCGTARILDYLPESINYCGFDASATYIDTAAQRYGKRGEFICVDVDQAGLDNLGTFDIVLASGVLHHLDDEHANGLMELARRRMRTGGRLLTIDPCLAADQSPIARYLITHDRGRFVRDSNGYASIAHQVFQEVHGTLRHRRWMPYTHWIMECSTC